MITSFSSFKHSVTKVKSFQTFGMNTINFAPFFQLVFGANASQTATLLRIKKSDLAGLVPSANNSAQGLLVAILIKTLAYNSQRNSIYVYRWGAHISSNLLINQIIISLFNQLIPVDTYEIPEPTNIINPMEY